jgi:phosphonatase-like hydrolase
MISMVVFDMAGTVVNEQNVVYKTLQKALNAGGIPVTLEQVLADGAGKEKKAAIIDIAEKYAPGQPSAAIDKMFQHFLEELDKAYADLDVIPIEGAEEVFELLIENGIWVVLNTGYNRETAEKLIAKLGWIKEDHFDELVTASDVPNARPHPDMILHAMELFEMSDASEVLKIGDSNIDIEEGKNAGCGITVGITTGAQTREQLAAASPDHIIDSLMDLPGLLGLAKEKS